MFVPMGLRGVHDEFDQETAFDLVDRDRPGVSDTQTRGEVLEPAHRPERGSGSHQMPLNTKRFEQRKVMTTSSR